MSQQRLILRIIELVFLGGMLGLVGYIDLATGFEISVFPLYALPISLAAWYFGGWAAVVTAISSACVWYWADTASGHVYTEPWVVYLNGGSRLFFFLFVALSVSYMITTVRRFRVKLQAFSGTLTVCTQCRSIRDRDSYWLDSNAYLREYSDAVIQPKLCPDCARQTYATPAEPSNLNHE